MLSPDSILRRLPAELDRKQALFFDGIRHTGEIATLAHSRLLETLTVIATRELPPDEARGMFASAFLDAWSLVDVIDRFRALWASLPDAQPATPTAGSRSFREIAQPVRDLRNVADHLAQRADYVVAQKGTALGVLSWFTVLNADLTKGVICTIVPGTMKRATGPVVNPGGRRMQFPTGLVQLSAGEHSANLSEVLPEMEARIHELERILERELIRHVPNLGQAGADLLLKMYVDFLGSSERNAQCGES